MADGSEDNKWYVLNIPPDARLLARILNSKEKAEELGEIELEELFYEMAPLEGWIDVFDVEWYASVLKKCGAREIVIDLISRYKRGEHEGVYLETIESKRILYFKGDVDFTKLKKLLYN